MCGTERVNCVCFQLTKELMDNCKNCVQTYGTLEKKMRLRFALETLIRTCLPGGWMVLLCILFENLYFNNQKLFEFIYYDYYLFLL